MGRIIHQLLTDDQPYDKDNLKTLIPKLEVMFSKIEEIIEWIHEKENNYE